MLFRRRASKLSASSVRRILVVRNDRLGDFMLALPTFAMLKANLPHVELVGLVSAYTAPLAEACGWLDSVIVDESRGNGWAGGWALGERLALEHCDAALTLYPRGEADLGIWHSGIPERWAPASKLYQFFHNHRVVQRRSQSEKPEWEYNLDMARAFLRGLGIVDPKLPAPPYLRLDAELATAREVALRERNGIDPNLQLVFVHPGDGGSAANLDTDQYARLIGELRSENGHHVVITAGPGEMIKAEALAEALGESSYTIFRSDQGLVEFARHLQAADLVICGSTGPLHIAGALDVPTAAFYPAKRSSNALRWRTTNSPERRLAFSPPEGAAETDMHAIDLAAAADSISRQFLL